MRIKSIKINNLQLISCAEIIFDSINVIKGTNLDSPNSSSNGSGKTTLGINSILFNLYGEISELNLVDLISDGAKNTHTEGIYTIGNDTYKIIREIPSKITVFKNDKELEDFANDTMKQRYINEVFGDLKTFQMFRMIDNANGISLLELGSISLRKTLMSFIDDYFGEIRDRLLAEKRNKELYSVDKKVTTHYPSLTRKDALHAILAKINGYIKEVSGEIDEVNIAISKRYGDIHSNTNIINYIQSTIQKLEKYAKCPICNTQLTNELKKQVKEDKLNNIKELQQKTQKLEESILPDKEYNSYNVEQKHKLENRQFKIKEWIMKLEESFKFEDYKFTKADIMLYSEAIKVIDQFSGFYISNWLSNLKIIINELLAKIGLKIEFIDNKQFIEIDDGIKKQKYEQLSSGQKCFLNFIFKISILMQNGETGLILADEGTSNLDNVNFMNLIEVVKEVPFQFVLIRQDLPEIEGVNVIEIERKKGISTIKGE